MCLEGTLYALECPNSLPPDGCAPRIHGNKIIFCCVPIDVDPAPGACADSSRAPPASLCVVAGTAHVPQLNAYLWLCTCSWALAVRARSGGSSGAQRGSLISLKIQWFDPRTCSLAPQEIVEEVRRRFGAFIHERIDPGARARDRAGIPIGRDLLGEAGDLGLFGFTVPVEVGGADRTWREWGLVLHEIGYLSADTAFPMLLAYCGTITKLLYETGRRDLIDRYVRPMAQGRRFGGFAWSEGHDPFSFRTVLAKAGQGYRLTGEKVPVADGQIADVFMLFARSEETGDVVALLAPRDDPGVEVTPYQATGLRASGMAKITFQQVEIHDDRVIVPADGLSYGQRFLNERRLEMPCWALGRVRWLFETCVHELSRRVRYKLPLTEMQTVQAAIGRMYVGIETSRLVILRALEHVDREDYDRLWDPSLAVAKYHVIEQALTMCRTLQDILGGAGVFEECPYERPIRDLSCLNAIAGTLATLEVDLGILATSDVERRKKRRAGEGKESS